MGSSVTLESRVTKVVVPPSIAFVEVLPAVLLALATVPMWLQTLLPQRLTINEALHDLECVDPGLQLPRVNQGPQDVVVEVPETQGDAA